MITKFLDDEDGITAIEYGLIISLIMLVCITSIYSVGQKLQATFVDVAAVL